MDFDTLDNPSSDNESSTQKHLISSLVRFGLFGSTRRTALRVDDMRSKLGGVTASEFRSALKRANEVLIETFGLEFVPYASKDEVINRAPLENRSTLPLSTLTVGSQASQDTKFYSKPAYLVRRVSPSDLIGSFPLHMATNDSISLSATVIVLTLVFLNGMSMEQAQLIHHLRTLRFDVIQTKDQELEKYLTSLCKSGYLAVITPSLSTQSSDVRANQSANDMLEYVWGPRALIEFDMESICLFVSETLGIELDDGLIEKLRKVSGEQIIVPSSNPPATLASQ